MKHVIPAPYSYGNPAAMGGVPAGGIALVQSASGTTADGSAGLTVPFGAAVVSGAGRAAANGTYTYRGQSSGKPYFNKVGEADSTTLYALVWGDFGDGTLWYITDSGGDGLYEGATNKALPWQPVWTNFNGPLPAPTVTCSSPVG